LPDNDRTDLEHRHCRQGKALSSRRVWRAIFRFPATFDGIAQHEDPTKPRRFAGALQKKTVGHAAIPGAFA